MFTLFSRRPELDHALAQQDLDADDAVLEGTDASAALPPSVSEAAPLSIAEDAEWADGVDEVELTRLQDVIPFLSNLPSSGDEFEAERQQRRFRKQRYLNVGGPNVGEETICEAVLDILGPKCRAGE